MARIDYWHTELPAMGSRKIAAKLRDEGYKVGRKLVRAYMREMEIYAIYPKPNLSKNDGKEGVVPYLLRHKTALFPNQYSSFCCNSAANAVIGKDDTINIITSRKASSFFITFLLISHLRLRIDKV